MPYSHHDFISNVELKDKCERNKHLTSPGLISIAIGQNWYCFTSFVIVEKQHYIRKIIMNPNGLVSGWAGCLMPAKPTTVNRSSGSRLICFSNILKLKAAIVNIFTLTVGQITICNVNKVTCKDEPTGIFFFLPNSTIPLSFTEHFSVF